MISDPANALGALAGKAHLKYLETKAVVGGTTAIQGTAKTGRPYEAGIALLPVDPEIVLWNAEACAASEPVIAAGGEDEGDPDLEARLARVNELSDQLNQRVAAIARA